jgi:hypothetical protein
MSYEGTRDLVLQVGAAVYERYVAGEPVAINLHGKPELEVVSFEPFSYKWQRGFFNRAPNFAGRTALRQLITSPANGGGTLVYAAIKTQPNAGYGFEVSIESFNSIAHMVDKGEIQLHQIGT